MQGADSPLDTERDVFVVNLGGFDTHSDLLEDFSAKMQVRIYLYAVAAVVCYVRWIILQNVCCIIRNLISYELAKLHSAAEMTFACGAFERPLCFALCTRMTPCRVDNAHRS